MSTSLSKTFWLALIMAIILIAPLLLAGNGTGIQQLPAQLPAPATDRISAAELNRRKSQAKGAFINAKRPGQPRTTISGYDIYSDSIILQQGSTHTLLPRHSVIYLPDSLRGKIVSQARGNFVPWPQFYLNNRSWIFTHEITVKQALGNAPLNHGVRDQFAKINRVVVAIHRNNPISLVTPSRNSNTHDQ